VPLSAYWRIVEQLTDGKSVAEVVQLVIQCTGIKTLKVVTQVVEKVAENLRQIHADQRKALASTSTSTSTSVPSKAKRVSTYRASRIEARRELEAAEKTLQEALAEEKKLVKTALSLSRRKEKLEEAKLSSADRRKTVGAIDQEMKQVLEMHKDVEVQIECAKRLTVIHKASLA
jgi:chromosome segregation ATPase